MRSLRAILILLASVAAAHAAEPSASAPPAFDEGAFQDLISILEQRGIVTGEEASRLVERVRTAAAAPPREGSDAGVHVSHEPGEGVTFSAPDARFRTTLGGWLQLRATGTDFDDRRLIQRRKDDQGTFGVARARMRLSGVAWRENLEYALEIDVADGAELKDAFVLWRPRRIASLQLGQFKVPYSRQQLVSDRKQQFVERAVTDDFFAPGREAGGAWLGRSKTGRHRWWLALSTGEGENDDNTDNQYRWTARYEVSSRQPLPQAESAEDGAEDGIESLRWGIGVSAFSDVDRADIDGDRIIDDDIDVLSGQLDITLVGRRWSATAEGFWRESDPVLTERDPASRDNTVRAKGFLVQAGGFVVARKLELAIRHARHSTEGDLFEENSATESLLGVNWFLSRHGLKFSADVGRVKSHGTLLDPEVSDRRLRMQVQYSF